MTETFTDNKGASTLNVIIVLDRSGSMDCIRQSTVDAFNAFVDKQRKEPGVETTRFSLYIFSDIVQRLWDNVPIGQVTDLTPSNYHPHGQTALLDAIAAAVNETGQRLQQGEVLVIVLTDGEENHSRIFNFLMVRDLIQRKIEENWEFIWLGSSEHSREYALGLGIPAENIDLFEVTDVGISDSSDRISDSVSRKRRFHSTSGWKGEPVTPVAPVPTPAPGKKHTKKP
jgi:hypothetical protein